MPDKTDWPSVICGWQEVIPFVQQHRNTRMIVEAHGNGAVRVSMPTREALQEFLAG